MNQIPVYHSDISKLNRKLNYNSPYSIFKVSRITKNTVSSSHTDPTVEDAITRLLKNTPLKSRTKEVINHYHIDKLLGSPEVYLLYVYLWKDEKGPHQWKLEYR